MSGLTEAFIENNYWTADESGSSAWIVNFNNGNENLNSKTNNNRVRAVRKS